MKYLAHYPLDVQASIRRMIDQQTLGAYIRNKYPDTHSIQTDKSLYQYVTNLKRSRLKHAPQIDKVCFDAKLDVVHHALGLHTAISRQHGGKLIAKKEIRVATLFKTAPVDFLQMIVVHELAHLKEQEHNKNFYQLCCYMLPDYHQLEFDMRVYLTCLDLKL